MPHKLSSRIGISKKRTIVFCVIASLIALMIVSEWMPVEITSAQAGSNGYSWTSFTSDYNDSRYQPNSPVNSSNVGSLQFAWFYQANHSVTSEPLVDNGHVYFSDWGGNVYSLSLANGSVNGTGDWDTNVVNELGLVNFALSSTPALANGLVYVAGSPLYSTQTNRSILFALNQSTGALEWNTALRYGAGGVYSSPIVYNGLVYVGESDCHEAGEGAYCSEAIDSNVGELFAVNATTGTLKWSFKTGNDSPGGAWGGGVWGSVALDPSLNSLYLGTGNSFNANVTSPNLNAYSYSILSLNAMTGALNWNYTIAPNQQVGDDNDFGSSPNLFTLDYKGTMYQAVGLSPKTGPYYILNRQNGALITTISITNSPNGNIGVAGFIYQNGTSSSGKPVIFLPANSGYVEEFNPWTSNTPVQSSIKIGTLDGAEVAVVPGAVFVGDESGNLYAFSTDDLSQLWSAKLPGVQTGYGVQSGVTVAAGYVLVGVTENSPLKETPTTNDGGLYAYSLPPNELTQPTTTTTTSSSSSVNQTSSSSSSSSSQPSSSTTSSTSGQLTSTTKTTTTSSSPGSTGFPLSTAVIVAAVIVAVVIVGGTVGALFLRKR